MRAGQFLSREKRASVYVSTGCHYHTSWQAARRSSKGGPPCSLPQGVTGKGLPGSVQGTLAECSSLGISLPVLLTTAVRLHLRGPSRQASGKLSDGTPCLQLFPAAPCSQPWYLPLIPEAPLQTSDSGVEQELLRRCLGSVPCLPWAHPPSEPVCARCTQPSGLPASQAWGTHPERLLGTLSYGSSHWRRQGTDDDRGSHGRRTQNFLGPRM